MLVLVAIPIGDPPPFVWYVTWSPVFNWWFGIKIDCVGMNSSVIPAPGLEKLIVVPIPTPRFVPIPTDSIGLK